MSIFRRRASDPDSAGTDAGIETEAEPAVDARANGPKDESEVDGVGERLDLGAIWVPPIQGLELRLEVDQATDTINGLQLVIRESAAQVQAFAAPRSGGLWDEIRAELATAVAGAGGTVEEVPTDLGPRLDVLMPQAGPNGQVTLAPARFVGIDGPRWFVRVVLSGRAATEEDAAAPLLDAVRSLVIVRGTSPMAPRELLPLHIPQPPAAEADTPDNLDTPDEAPSLNPFERGPEITEVR